MAASYHFCMSTTVVQIATIITSGPQGLRASLKQGQNMESPNIVRYLMTGSEIYMWFQLVLAIQIEPTISSNIKVTCFAR